MRLFQSIFGRGETRGHYPEWLIEAATERAVEGTDSRLRVLSGYRRRLREPVIRAIDHVVALVDGIAAPIPAGYQGYRAEPRLGALFASADEMLNVFSRDDALRDFLATPEGSSAPQITALLLAGRIERNVLGMDLTGERVRREVAQVTVSFAGHRLLDPQASEAETRRQLKRRAFDHLLSLALMRIAETRVERADLVRQRDLLRRKQRALEGGGWGFEPAEGGHPDPDALAAELDGITAQLEALGADDQVLGKHLEIVAELLGKPESQLWTEDVVLFLDSMNIQRNESDPSARPIRLREFHNARGLTAVMLPIAVAVDELPPREDLVTAAERYLY